MAKTEHRWRQWRKKRDKRVVLTGIAGNLGREVARRLHRDWDVIGIDRRRVKGLPPDVEFHQLDIRRRKTEDLFRKGHIDALIHLNIMHNPRQSNREHHEFNIVGTQKIFELAQQHGVGKIILLSSANVYGPAATNNQFLTEEAPLLAGENFEGIRDLVAVDMYASSFFWRHPEIETVILRPVHIVGQVRNAPSNYLRKQKVMTLLGYDPMVQLIHVNDVIEAILCGLRPGIRGIYNIAGPGELPLSELVRQLDRERFPVPEPIARPVLAALFQARLSSFPVDELDHIKYVCMVDDSRAREQMRYQPTMTMEQTLATLR